MSKKATQTSVSTWKKLCLESAEQDGTFCKNQLLGLESSEVKLRSAPSTTLTSTRSYITKTRASTRSFLMHQMLSMHLTFASGWGNHRKFRRKTTGFHLRYKIQLIWQSTKNNTSATSGTPIDSFLQQQQQQQQPTLNWMLCDNQRSFERVIALPAVE